MSDPNIPTADSVFLINAHVAPPRCGDSVLVLTRGGVLTTTVWGKESLKYFDAWCPRPRVPQDVRILQGARFYAEKKCLHQRTKSVYCKQGMGLLECVDCHMLKDKFGAWDVSSQG